MNLPQHDFEQVTALIHKYDHALRTETLTAEKIKKSQAKLDELADKYQNDESLGSSRYKLYELQALLDFSQGQVGKAEDFIRAARSLMTEQDSFVSDTVAEYAATQMVSTSDRAGTKRYSGKLEGWLTLYVLRIVILPILLVVDVVSTRSLPTNIDASSALGNSLSHYLAFATVADIIPLLGVLLVWYVFFSKLKTARIIIQAFETYLALYYVVAAFWLDSIVTNPSYGFKPGASAAVAQLTWGFIVALAWLIYWVRSKRVKATFIHE